MRRRLAIAGVAWAAALLSLPVVLGPFEIGRAPESENRSPAGAPSEFAPWDTDWFAEVTDWVEDRLALQGSAARALREFDLATTNQIQSDDVLVGEDGFLFLADAFDTPCLDEVPLQADEQRLDAVVDGIERLGARPIVMIVPDKGVAEADRVPVASRGKAQCLRERAIAVEAFLQRRLGRDAVRMLDLLTTVPTSWLPEDTHWNPGGRLRALEALAESLRPGLWDLAGVTPRPSDRELDLRTLAGVPRTIDVVDHTIAMPDPYAPRTVFLHDSFVAAWGGEFEGLFQDVVRVHFRDLEGEEVPAMLAAADTIVIESVGRQAWGESARLEQLREVLDAAAGSG